jgi:hypothetical protein
MNVLGRLFGLKSRLFLYNSVKVNPALVYILSRWPASSWGIFSKYSAIILFCGILCTAQVVGIGIPGLHRGLADWLVPRELPVSTVHSSYLQPAH